MVPAAQAKVCPAFRSSSVSCVPPRIAGTPLHRKSIQCGVFLFHFELVPRVTSVRSGSSQFPPHRARMPRQYRHDMTAFLQSFFTRLATCHIPDVLHQQLDRCAAMFARSLSDQSHLILPVSFQWHPMILPASRTNGLPTSALKAMQRVCQL